MRIYSIVSAAVSGVLMTGVSTFAFAGSCANGANCGSSYNAALAPYEGVPSAVCRARLEAGNRVSTCSTRSVVHAAAADPMAQINYTYSNPYGYLESFAYKNTPDVNIMQIYARPQMAALNNVPTQFTYGCNPITTNSCGRQTEVIISAPAPVVQAPVFKPIMRPAPIPVMRPAPLPVVRPIYRPAPIAPVAPVQIGYCIPTQVSPCQPVNNVMIGPGNNAMMGNVVGGNVIGHVSGGSYTYQKQGTSDYWEKASGATTVEGLPVTQIVCRRAGTAGTTQTVNVVRPVIGVPTAVPVMRPNCLPVSGPIAPIAMPMAGSRWTN